MFWSPQYPFSTLNKMQLWGFLSQSCTFLGEVYILARTDLAVVMLVCFQGKKIKFFLQGLYSLSRNLGRKRDREVYSAFQMPRTTLVSALFLLQLLISILPEHSFDIPPNNSIAVYNQNWFLWFATEES